MGGQIHTDLHLRQMKQTIINIAPIGKQFTATIIVTDEEGTRTERHTLTPEQVAAITAIIKGED